MAMFEQIVLKVGLENVPYLRLKLTNTGVQGVIHALKWVKIQLVQSGDDDSDMSEIDTSHASLSLDRSEADPPALNHGGPEREEEEISEHSSSPDAMDQDDVLGRDTHLDGGLANDAGVAPGRISGFQSEEMDTIAQPPKVESCSDRPRESQDVWYNRSSPDSDWGDGESQTARRRRLYPKVPPYVIPVPPRINSGWYQKEDLMDPREVASPARRVGRLNVDGSIGGDKGHSLPPRRPGRLYSHYIRELDRQVTYSRAEKDEKVRSPYITEQECLERTKHQDTACKGDAYWKDQLAQYHYLPTPEDSPVNFSYRVRTSTYAVPYHVVGPMSWEYPYHSGQAQEDLPN